MIEIDLSIKNNISAGAVLAGSGLCTAIAYALLAWVSRADGHPPLTVFFACTGVGVAGWLWAFLRLRDRGASCIKTVVIFALLFRCAGFFGTPLYEDDFYRYLWDGHKFGTTGTPYGHTPAESFGRTNLPANLQEILGGINHPELPTIYGPVCQLTFLLAWWIAPGALWPLKLIYVLVDCGLIVLIWRTGRRASDVVLYSWCPLVIKEVAFTAHTDILAACLLFLSWKFIADGRQCRAGVYLGAALAAKVTVLFAAPVILWRAGRRAWIACAVVLTAFYAPFVMTGATDFDGLRAFTRGWEFNSFGFTALQWMFGASAAKVAALGLFSIFCAYVCFRRPEWLRADLLLGVFFFVAPVVNPWYLILIAPFVAIHPSATGIAAVSIVLLSYATSGNLGRSGGQFDHPLWVRLVEAGTIGAGLVLDIFRRR